VIPILKTLSKKEILKYLTTLLSNMSKKEVLAALLDDKKTAILKTVLNTKEEMYLQEISQLSKVSLSSTYRILQELVNLTILQRREWKTSKVYKAQDNEKVEFLKELFHEEFDGILEFLETVKDFSGIQSIILHGQRSRSKANVLLIGEYINQDRIDEVCRSLQLKGFELTFLILTKSQYEQMSRMGMYQGEKKILK